MGVLKGNKGIGTAALESIIAKTGAVVRGISEVAGGMRTLFFGSARLNTLKRAMGSKY
jgi:hypothetical protein